MVDESLIRIALLLDEKKLNQLANCNVAVIGLGGVGAMAAEALVRCGVKHLILVDHDVVSISNLNRQIQSTQKTIGHKKVDALAQRLLSIHPDVMITRMDTFISEDNIADVLGTSVSAVIDAIDTVSGKCAIIEHCQNHQIPMISSLGMGNRMDPTKVSIVKLSQTKEDPLAKVMRYQVRKRKLNLHMPVVFSSEIPKKQTIELNDSVIRKEKMPPSSSPFVPLASGLACAYYIVSKLTEETE